MKLIATESTKIVRTCKASECGKQFTPGRADKLYCCVACRKKTTGNQSQNRKRSEARASKTCKRCSGPVNGRWITKALCAGCEEAEQLRRTEHVLTFIPVDGEGHKVTDADGNITDHYYDQLACGDDILTAVPGRPYLEWWEIFEFLYSHYEKNPMAVFVGFFLGYDFDQWLRRLPWDRARKLITSQGKDERKLRNKRNNRPGYLPVDLTKDDHRWQIEMLGNKRLSIRPRVCDCNKGYCGHDKKQWMHICDAGPFFQTSLLKAVDPSERQVSDQIVTPDEYAILIEGKAHRGEAIPDYGHTGITWFDSLAPQEKIKVYNTTENKALTGLMRQLNKGLTEMGVRLPKSRWYGPGAIADELYRMHGSMRASRPPVPEALREKIENHSCQCEPHCDATCHNPCNCPTRGWAWDKCTPFLDEITPAPFLNAATYSYFGGWTEIMAHGHVPYAVEYDLCSAYPAVIVKLPCLAHGKYDLNGRVTGKTPRPPKLKDGQIRLVYARVQGSDTRIGPMLHRRDKGLIRRPLATTGWFWEHELNAAVRAGLIDKIAYIKWMTYTPDCQCPPPMAWVEELYNKRLEIGKNTPTGKAFKLGPNSAYGKTAQSVGMPKYANPVYASLITAGTRAMILDAIATHPLKSKGVVYVATDGIAFIQPHPAIDAEIERYCNETGKKQDDRLGYWEKKEKTNLCLFKPGVYWDDKTRQDIQEGKSARFKSRGVSAKAMQHELWKADEQFKLFPLYVTEHKQKKACRVGEIEWPTVSFPLGFAYKSPKSALAVTQVNQVEYDDMVDSETGDETHGNKCDCKKCRYQRKHWREAGKEREVTVVQDSNPVTKRDTSAMVNENGIWWSKPYKAVIKADGTEETSLWYDKSFGRAIQEANGETVEEYAHTQHGTVSDMVNGILGLNGAGEGSNEGWETLWG